MTDANSSFSGGAQLQPTTIMNTDSFMRVPASPISFSSNNISGSSVIDGSIMQQSPPQEQVQKQMSSSITSRPVIEAGSALHAQKKSRIDVRQDDILQHQLIQQLLHGQSSLHLQGQQNPQLQGLIQQDKLAQIQQQQQQQLLQPFAQIQQSQIGIPRQPQLRPPLAQPRMQLAGPIRSPVESGLCSRRLMQYLYHKRHRPENNPITYWKKLVEEYFAPRARERWCVSSYEKRGNSSVSTPQTALDTWRCDICSTHGGKGYEATYEVLPRLCQIRFDHGVIDEYLFLDMPNEFWLPSGLMLLEHTKVVQKSVYEHLHVTHEGHLRIIFTPELKIMSWEFCSRRHDEYITRRILAPQVNNLLQVAHKYQAVTTESGPAGVSNNDAQTICNMFVTASRQLAKNLEHHTLNEHGLSKRYVRCLQISEVVNHMKDLIEFTNKNNLGPIEGLNKYGKPTVPKLPVQNPHDAKQLMAAAVLPNDQSTTKVMGVKQEISAHVDNGTPGVGVVGNNTPQNAAALNNYQNMLRSSSANQSLLRQEASSAFKGPAAMHNGIQLEASRSFHGPSQVQLAQFQRTVSFQHPMPQQNYHQGLSVSPQYQQHVIHQLLQEVKNTNSRALVRQPPRDTPNVNSGLASGAANTNSAASGEQARRVNNGMVKGAAAVGTGPSNVINSTASIVPSRSNSFKSVSSIPAAATGGNAATSKAESFHEMDELDPLITNELVESGLFMGDQDGTGFSWNM
ncbi:probable transcriptional regulator SLK2 [Phragmites australis]|uniref:probable transcriptional regulator SLK2 n=1 Tax=Phragmites australis TaxID=29695 RepID=UPI002D77C771|nr:probable transcriptional regulator SLK2 [Phragmites australis]XP_062188739.1 probable transcriptional regulator SLK2 [Phragmites australis]XP_062188740.1 probable transcriptional regulator SLK2 [Phragmites australis]XP_062188741.1 probable transcriptional regulator SLK2 [Phragmites australis]XP_062188742.1 probable transcriptional regulator SLK2 [Phragmites australis]XP_062188743.1 probable transcriptional regulator SLK2 [Phragmites australis]